MSRYGGCLLGALLVAGGAVTGAGEPGMPASAMPGAPHTGPLPPLAEGERELATRLEADVRTLAGEIGERHAGGFRVRGLRAAEAFLDATLRAAGHAVEREAYEARGVTAANLVAERRGTTRPEEIVVVGAHYDTAGGTPGANDNGSGTAATLALARAWAERRPARTLRFVFFANEEPPWFQTDDMGSLRYARGCRRRGERIVAMLSLETLGYYTDAPGTQRFDSLPPLRLLYPDTGNFVAFVADVGSADLVRRVVGTFRRTTRFPAYGCALPGAIRGVGWSDHWSFWQAGYPGVMVTDTAVFRYPHYHAPEDTPDKLDYDRLARVVAGLGRVVDDLVAGGEAAPQPVEATSPGAAED